MMERRMKDSGIPWIGMIPEDWKVSKIGELYTNRYERVSDRDFPPLSVTMQGILPQLETAAKTDDGDNRKLVRKGDFAINSRSDRRGSCGISPYDGSVSLINLILAPRNEMNANYYNWLFHTSLFADEFYSWGHGIVADLWTTRWQEMKNIVIPFPTLKEQAAIASWLDEKCGVIDELIEVEQKMVEELEAYRQATITKTVTRGLNPDAPMRQTGISWIPEIPQHWEIYRIKYYSDDHRTRGEKGKYIGLENIVSFHCTYIPSDSQYDLSQSLKADNGDVLFGKLRPYLGKSLVIKEESCCSSEFVIFKKPSVPEFLKYLLITDWFVTIVDSSTYGTKMPRANVDFIRNMTVPIPPPSEQQAIATYLDTKCKEIDELIAVKREKIETLKQYRQSIIFEAVTGKLNI